jgi:membrane protease YdiL (CAAX protease family)
MSTARPLADDQFAASLRGFGPVGLLAILLILSGNLFFAPLSALLVLAWVHRSHTPWREIGYVQPGHWWRDALLGIAGGLALRLLMQVIVMPLLGHHSINQQFHFLVGNMAALPGVALFLLINSGFGEETLFRGYLFERMRKLFGNTRVAMIAIVLLTSALFGLAHYPEQGWMGVAQSTIAGMVYGTAFAITGRIWPVMWAHAAFNLLAIAIIYLNLEAEIGHLLFE